MKKLAEYLGGVFVALYFFACLLALVFTCGCSTMWHTHPIPGGGETGRPNDPVLAAGGALIGLSIGISAGTGLLAGFLPKLLRFVIPNLPGVVSMTEGKKQWIGYLVAGLIGFATCYFFTDYAFWTVLALVLAGVVILGFKMYLSYRSKKNVSVVKNP